MMPNSQTPFLPLSEIEKFTQKGYFCCAVVFSPETENSHYKGCPPYIQLSNPTCSEEVYFLVPETIAYYGKVHAAYTMKGHEKSEERGRKRLAEELKELLYIEDKD